MASDEQIEPLSIKEGVSIEDFAEVAEEKARGHGILDEPQDIDLKLVGFSASYLDPDGTLRTFQVTSDGFDPEEYDD